MLKNVMKKIISLFLATMLVLSLFVFSVSASSSAVIYATDVTAKPGDTVKIEIMLDFNPGINTLRLFLDYSSEYFELTNSTDGGILGKSTHSKELSAKPYVLYWTNSSKDDFTKNGVLATLEFKVKQGTPSGGYPLTLYFKSANDCINSKLSAVTVELDNGIITVENDEDLKSSSSKQSLSSSVNSILPSQTIVPSKPNTVSDSLLSFQSATSKTQQSQSSQNSVINTENSSSYTSGNDSDNINSQNSLVSNEQPIHKKTNNALLIALIVVVVVAVLVAIFILLRLNKKTT